MCLLLRIVGWLLPKCFIWMSLFVSHGSGHENVVRQEFHENERLDPVVREHENAAR